MPRQPAAILAALVLSIPLAAIAQPIDVNPVRSRVLERLHEEGVDVPEARVLFYWDETTSMCVALGIKEGPNEIRPGFLVFQGRSEETPKPVRVKFEFDRKQLRKEKGLLIWDSCLDGEAPLDEGEEVQVTLRRPRRPTQTFVVELPTDSVAAGIDLWPGIDGRLEARPRITQLDEAGGS